MPKTKTRTRRTAVRRTATGRIDHSLCAHVNSGPEGRKARAQCRREHPLK